MKKALLLILLALCFIGFATPVTTSGALCPFCAAPMQTFSEEIELMDLVVFAELLQVPDDPDQEDATGDLPKCTFRIAKIVRGDAWHKVGDTIQVHYFGSEKIGKTFLIMGTDPPQTMWGTPLIISDRAQEYLLKLPELPKTHERLQFFVQHLEDEEELLARDAYDEFAKTPYEGVIALKPHMDREMLIEWITDPDVRTDRRRLYLTLLGICGTRDDCGFLEEMLRTEDQEAKNGLDALIACYLSLCGEEGLPLIEQLFLANPDAEYRDTYSAILAYRFHGNDADVISREKLLPGLRAVLERPDLADLVIPDLARWQDWDVIPKLAQLFKEADADTSWVRVPVINYLRACPRDEAQQVMEELKQIDPEAVERANAYFPYTQFAGKAPEEAPVAEEAEQAEDPESSILADRRKIIPRDRSVYDDKVSVAEEPPSRWWISTVAFGALLIVALLLKFVQRK